ncbi:hypothetical protein ASG35_18945 [Burkholderia sp. Leaf177]|uniref:nuclease-related domain-containing protein n=1 Tax=Burkholderia sp. Leaf177 TaxID=1736287 RepID=UPI0006F74D09|nr:nuclease-related domain-containing protein [Burkholderia sp. Leaf177]KQR74790.1 hypothetical protein ASG35_18945 [Burkholderia sp. Leaf177]
MQNIELYYGSRKLLSSEKIVLARIIEWLSLHHIPAVIYTNVKINWNEIDILVGTPNTTLVIEVKGYRNPVSGRENGKWISTNARGQTKLHTNGYEQVIEAYRAIKRQMELLSGSVVNVSYPKAAVVFEGGIPEGSDLFTPVDDRVVICGIERLTELLAHRSQHPWSLQSLRELATALRLTPNRGPRAGERARVLSIVEAQEEAATFHAAAASHRSEEASGLPSAASQVRKAAHQEKAAFATSLSATTHFGARAAPPYVDVDFNAINPVRYRKRRVRRIAGVMLIALMAVCAARYAYVWMSKGKSSKADVSTAAPLSAQKVLPKGPVKRRPKAEARESQRKSAENMLSVPATSSARSTALSAPAPPAQITCPPGVDRLGCNGRVGVMSAPVCPTGFIVSGETCILAGR